MAFSNNPEQKTPVAYDIHGPDISKLSPAGISDVPEIERHWRELTGANENLANSLEKRYENPNWLKVSAAMLKPQLGGFAASLGSAADVIGENAEQQKAIAPTIARMRAETAAMSIPLSQQTEQQKRFKKYLANGKKDTSELAEIFNLAPNSSAATAIKAQLDAESSKAGTQATTTQTSIQGQEAAMKHPALVLPNDEMWKGTVADNNPQKSQSYLQNLNNARPKDIPDDKWNSMSISQKQDAIGKYGNDLVLQGLQEEGKSAQKAESGNNLLGDLSYLRELATDKKLAPIFSVANNGDLFSQYKAFLDKYPGNAQMAMDGLVNAMLQGIKNPDADTREKVDKLVKGIKRLELNTRGANANPTDALQYLNENASPNLLNSQAGFVSILDQMALTARRDIDRHNLRVKSDIPAREYWTDPKLERVYQERLRESAKNNSLSISPSWYERPLLSTESTQTKPVSNPKQSATPTTERPTTRVFNNITYYLQPDNSYSKTPPKP